MRIQILILGFKGLSSVKKRVKYSSKVCASHEWTRLGAHNLHEVVLRRFHRPFLERFWRESRIESRI